MSEAIWQGVIGLVILALAPWLVRRIAYSISEGWHSAKRRSWKDTVKSLTGMRSPDEEED